MTRLINLIAVLLVTISGSALGQQVTTKNLPACPDKPGAFRRRRFAYLILLIFFCPAQADWVSIEKNEQLEMFLDLDTLQKEASNRKIWTLINLFQKDRDGVSSLKGYVEYDCAGFRSRTIEETWWSENFGQGADLTPSGRNEKADRWTYIRPGTTGGAKLQIVCGIRD